MRILLAALPLALVLTATACGGDGPVAENADNAAAINEAVADANEVAEAAHDVGNATAAAELNDAEDSGSENGPPTPAHSISFPMEMRGRWGMVPNDCQPGRADAKGLITIGERSVMFYESVGRLKQPRPSPANSVSGIFAFTGEGQNWEKSMTFTRAGDTLARAEKEGRFTYRRC